MKERDMDIADAIMGRPFGFSVGHRQFYIYPLSLGKVLLLQRLIDSLEISQYNMRLNPTLETMRVAREKRNECLTIIAYQTLKTKDEVFDHQLLNETISFFDNEMTREDIVSLLLMILNMEKTADFMKHLGIDKEQRRLAEVNRIKEKDNKGSISFGGKSIFGTLIDAACERYGWTKDYVVWGIDYASLRLLLADKVVTLFLSDKERKAIPQHLLNEEETIKGTKENMERIKAMNWR